MGGKVWRIGIDKFAALAFSRLLQIWAYACICPNLTAISETDSQMNASLTRCCPDTLLVHYDDDNGSISCPRGTDTEANQNIKECLEHSFWKETRWNKINQTSISSMEVSQTVRYLRSKLLQKYLSKLAATWRQGRPVGGEILRGYCR